MTLRRLRLLVILIINLNLTLLKFTLRESSIIIRSKKVRRIVLLVTSIFGFMLAFSNLDYVNYSHGSFRHGSFQSSFLGIIIMLLGSFFAIFISSFQGIALWRRWLMRIGGGLTFSWMLLVILLIPGNQDNLKMMLELTLFVVVPYLIFVFIGRW